MREYTTRHIDEHWQYHKDYLVEILNGVYTVDEAREDLDSLIGSDNVTSNIHDKDTK